MVVPSSDHWQRTLKSALTRWRAAERVQFFPVPALVGRLHLLLRHALALEDLLDAPLYLLLCFLPAFGW